MIAAEGEGEGAPAGRSCALLGASAALIFAGAVPVGAMVVAEG